jgi:hypothetical protein
LTNSGWLSRCADTNTGELLTITLPPSVMSRKSRGASASLP